MNDKINPLGGSSPGGTNIKPDATQTLKKTSDRKTLLDRIKEQPTEFRVFDIMHGDLKLRQTANVVLGDLRKAGELKCTRTRQDAVWSKTEQFGTSTFWEKKPRKAVTTERKAQLKAISKLPRRIKPTKIIVVLETLQKMPKLFAIKDLSATDKSIKVNTAREVVRLLSIAGDLGADGSRPNAEWKKTAKFGKSELWKLVTSPGTVKFRAIRDDLTKEKTPGGETKTSIILNRIKKINEDFKSSDIIQGDPDLHLLTNGTLGRLLKAGELTKRKEHREYYWSKTEKFGSTTTIWANVKDTNQSKA